MKRLVIIFVSVAMFLLIVGGTLAGSQIITGDCTGWFANGWNNCCVIHDIQYNHSGVSKSVADYNLASCVADTGHIGMALLMYLAVTLFGNLWYVE